MDDLEIEQSESNSHSRDSFDEIFEVSFDGKQVQKLSKRVIRDQGPRREEHVIDMKALRKENKRLAKDKKKKAEDKSRRRKKKR